MSSPALRPLERPARWLPRGKSAAVCFSIDDVHPACVADGCDAGGELSGGALGRLAGLQRRHAYLHATLCVTPDWRLDSLVPDSVLRRIPWVNRRIHWARRRRPRQFRLERHPDVVAWLNRAERCEVVPHGLTHSHPGPRLAVEFQNQTRAQCAAIVRKGLDIFESAHVEFVRGYVPPGWNAPPALIEALDDLDFEFICSARDLETSIGFDAVTGGSGLRGVSLIHPQFVGRGRLVHLSSNFQATSCFDRAFQILDAGGLLHVKAHIFKSAGGHVMLDGLDELYSNYLDLLFTCIAQRYGSSVWWATLSAVARRFRETA